MNFKSLLSKAAPFLGGLVGGPFGAIAGSVVKGLLTPGNDNPSDGELKIALENATPEQLLALKKEDIRLKAKQAEFEHKNKALLVDDSKDARKMNIETREYTPSILAYSILIGFFALMIGLFLDNHIPDGSSKVIFSLAGTVTTLLVTVFNFYFGRNTFNKKDK